jgi:hypothetical protein
MTPLGYGLDLADHHHILFLSHLLIKLSSAHTLYYYDSSFPPSVFCLSLILYSSPSIFCLLSLYTFLGTTKLRHPFLR